MKERIETPLSLRAVPYRPWSGKIPLTAPAGSDVVRCVLGKISDDPSRNSWRSSPLSVAGFQWLDPKSIGAAVEAPAIVALIGPALGEINPWAAAKFDQTAIIPIAK